MNNTSYISKQLTVASTTAVSIGLLPARAYPLRVYASIETAANNSGAQVIDVGISGTANHFVNDISVAATGTIAGTITAAGSKVQSTSESTEVFATFIPTGTPTAGTFIVTMEYAFLE